MSSTLTLPRPRAFDHLARRALPIAAACWCSVALLGQLMFAAYVLGLYGRSAAAGRFEQWNKVMPRGWVAGDPAANALLALHLLFTVLVIVGGAVQLLPWLRRHAPAVHRWNGRLYIASALIMGTGGLYMLWTRNPVGDLSQHVATSINGVLIVACAAVAWRHARARRIALHRVWALRLWLVVGGVWFFRIGLMGWLVLNRGPVGFDPKTFQGPTLTLLAFAQFVLPLALLQLYLRAREAGTGAQLAMAAGLAALTLLTALGIGAASMLMWLPRM